MTWDSIQQLVRIILQIAAGWLMSKGWITEEMATTAIGAILSLGGVIWWSAWQSSRPAVEAPKPGL